jgi:hypothetical protein
MDEATDVATVEEHEGPGLEEYLGCFDSGGTDTMPVGDSKSDVDQENNAGSLQAVKQPTLTRVLEVK